MKKLIILLLFLNVACDELKENPSLDDVHLSHEDKFILVDLAENCAGSFFGENYNQLGAFITSDVIEENQSIRVVDENGVVFYFREYLKDDLTFEVEYVKETQQLGTSFMEVVYQAKGDFDPETLSFVFENECSEPLRFKLEKKEASL